MIPIPQQIIKNNMEIKNSRKIATSSPPYCPAAEETTIRFLSRTNGDKLNGSGVKVRKLIDVYERPKDNSEPCSTHYGVRNSVVFGVQAPIRTISRTETWHKYQPLRKCCPLISTRL
jgi:hypothetical protein